jgi:hypothetical protein
MMEHSPSKHDPQPLQTAMQHAPSIVSHLLHASVQEQLLHNYATHWHVSAAQQHMKHSVPHISSTSPLTTQHMHIPLQMALFVDALMQQKQIIIRINVPPIPAPMRMLRLPSSHFPVSERL